VYDDGHRFDKVRADDADVCPTDVPRFLGKPVGHRKLLIVVDLGRRAFRISAVHLAELFAQRCWGERNP